MEPETYGLNPVAKFEEQCGDLYQTLDRVAESLDDEYELVSVVHGDAYLCERVTDDAYWWKIAEVKPGETGSWDSATDNAANSFPNTDSLIDVFGGNRYLVSQGND